MTRQMVIIHTGVTNGDGTDKVITDIILLTY